jgi:hypothetical protein
MVLTLYGILNLDTSSKRREENLGLLIYKAILTLVREEGLWKAGPFRIAYTGRYADLRNTRWSIAGRMTAG